MPENSLNNLKLLSIDGLVKIFGISKSTGYRIVESRKIPFYKINGAIRFSERDILKYLEDSRIDPIQYKR